MNISQRASLRTIAAISLTLLLGLTIFIREVQIASFHLHISERALTLLSIATLLLGAWLLGILFESFSLPRISGYIVFGILVGPSDYSLQILPSLEHVKEDLNFINYLAISLIAFLAGGEIKLEWLKGQLRRILTITIVDVVLVCVAIASLFYFLSPVLPFIGDLGSDNLVVVALLVSLVALANSPSVAIAMISDYRAKGPLSQTVLSLTVCKDMVLIMLFATALAVGKGVVFDESTMSLSFFLAITVQLGGSVVLGGAVGLLMALYVKRVAAHYVIFIIGCCMVFSLLGEENFQILGNKFHFEPLLMALFAGLTMQNLYPDSSHRLFQRMEDLSLPVYCMFFALAGAKVNVSEFATLWYFCIALAAIRAAVIFFAVLIARKAAGYSDEWASLIWLGLIPQAGVSLVLVALLMNTFAALPWSTSISSLLIGMIVINELLGPIGFRHALLKSGEATRSS